MSTNPSAMPEKTRTEDLPLISVIVPVYKVERYLDRCIQSIVDQTYRNLEIILVDDGSPDACPDMCDAWAARDCRIRVIHQENRGLGAARNSGIRISTGELIGFVDSDDWLEPTMYEVLYRSLTKENADTSMITGVLEYPNGRQIYLYHPDLHLVMTTSESFKYINARLFDNLCLEQAHQTFHSRKYSFPGRVHWRRLAIHLRYTCSERTNYF